MSETARHQQWQHASSTAGTWEVKKETAMASADRKKKAFQSPIGIEADRPRPEILVQPQDKRKIEALKIGDKWGQDKKRGLLEKGFEDIVATLSRWDARGGGIDKNAVRNGFRACVLVSLSSIAWQSGRVEKWKDAV